MGTSAMHSPLPIHENHAKLASINIMEVPTASENNIESDNDSVASSEDLIEDNIHDNPDIAKREAQQAALAEHVQRKQKRPKLIASNIAFDEEPVDGKDESARIIDKVRDYQQELFERAKQENVIAV